MKVETISESHVRVTGHVRGGRRATAELKGSTVTLTVHEGPLAGDLTWTDKDERAAMARLRELTFDLSHG